MQGPPAKPSLLGKTPRIGTWSWATQRHTTPHSVGCGLAEQLRSMHQAVLDGALRATPNRFRDRRPEPHALPTAVWANPPPTENINPTPSQPGAVIS